MRLTSMSFLTLSLRSTTLIACTDDPPSPSDVRGALTNDLGYVLREGTASTAAADNLPTGSAFGFATVALGDTDGAMLRAIRPVRHLLDDVSGTMKDQSLGVDEEAGADSDAIVKKL